MWAYVLFQKKNSHDRDIHGYALVCGTNFFLYKCVRHTCIVCVCARAPFSLLRGLAFFSITRIRTRLNTITNTQHTPNRRCLLLIARLQIICSLRIVFMKIGFRSGPLRASPFYVAWSVFDYKDDVHICTWCHKPTTYHVPTNICITWVYISYGGEDLNQCLLKHTKIVGTSTQGGGPLRRVETLPTLHR